MWYKILGDQMPADFWIKFFFHLKSILIEGQKIKIYII